LDDGTVVTKELAERDRLDELEAIRRTVGEDAYEAGRFDEASELFSRVSLSERFEDFLTIPAYACLP
jgi:malate synthase